VYCRYFGAYAEWLDSFESHFYHSLLFGIERKRGGGIPKADRRNGESCGKNRHDEFIRVAHGSVADKGTKPPQILAVCLTYCSTASGWSATIAYADRNMSKGIDYSPGARVIGGRL
jgi:hypothetical protein